MQSAYFAALIFYIWYVDGAGISRKRRQDRRPCSEGEVCDRSRAPEQLRFFLFGDIGGLPIFPYVTSVQKTVARTAGAMGDRLDISFQVALGDNFYNNGVTSETDHRFQMTFENVYTARSQQQPWYIVGGNHDHLGNIAGQIAYSDLSSRWNYPALYYKFSYDFGDPLKSADFIVIDTIVLCGNIFLDTAAMRTAKNTRPRDKRAAENHWRWIETQLGQSRADYLFVLGHYPVFSIGEHGSTHCLIDRLNPLLRKYRVTAYISGHDHNLQHLTTKLDDTSLHYIVSGAGSRSDNSKRHSNDVPWGSLRFHYPEVEHHSPDELISNFGPRFGGFVLGELDANQATFRFYSANGQELYSFSTGTGTRRLS